MGRFGVGQAVRRGEDRRFLTGRGSYAADINLPRQAHAVFLRSPHAHALIKAIDTAEAAAAPDVLGVFTAADVAADGLGALPCMAPVRNHNGSPMVDAPRPLLAAKRVRHVGEAVAMVVAESVAAASPIRQSKQVLLAASSHTSGAPGFTAAAVSATAGRGS